MKDAKTRLWALLPVALAAVTMHEMFSSSRLFFVRDLATLAWPIHLWAWRAVRGAESVLWDPYVGFGQSAISDSVRHLMFPPALLLRLLLPPVLGFNMLVG